jgi:hypothetical protein
VSTQANFLRLALKPDLDEETAYTICQLISAVGYEIKAFNWDWEWFSEKRGNYRSLISRALAVRAWRLLAEKDFLNLQATSDEMPRISTVAPLDAMTNLSTLGLQENHVTDLQPLSKMSKLKFLTIYRNKVSDPSPLVHMQSLEVLSLAYNPIESLAVLEQLPKLRWLSLSTDQAACFARCRSLPSIQVLEITGEAPVDNVASFPEMPSLKVLRVDQLRDTAGMERFPSLSTLRLIHGQFSRLDGVEKLKGLTHLEAWSSQPLTLQPLCALYALRSVEALAPEVTDLSALSRLPVLHEVHAGISNDSEKITCNRAELEALRKSLTPWSDEFRSPEAKTSPSPAVEIVSQETFEYYDSKASLGIKAGECEDGMFKSEREWMKDELFASLEAMNFKEGTDKDFFADA